MKRALLIFIISINFIKTDSSVLVPVKNVDSSLLQINKLTQRNNETSRTSNLPKTFLFNGSYVYLEDVLFVLKNQNWTEEEQPCYERTLSFLRNLQNFTLWAVWDWDSIPSEAQGIFYGSRFQLGNYDECMDAPWYEEHEELRTQYCLANIVLEKRQKTTKKIKSDPNNPYQSALNVLEYKPSYSRPINELTWGLCVPAVCQRESVTRLMGILLAHSHLGNAGIKANVKVGSCQKANEPLEFDGQFYAFMAFLIILIIAVLLSSILNTRNPNNRNCVTESFDISDNMKSLLKKKKERLDILYGLRFLSVWVVVLCHQIGMTNSGAVSNGSKADKDLLSIYGMIIVHKDVSVDTFFWLSGFLTAIFCTSSAIMARLPMVFLKRYLRVFVAYATMIFFASAVFAYTGSGPLMQNLIFERDACRKNWWISLLMLGNYVDTENICILVSWYIPCDFHFFILTMLMYWIYKRCPTFGKICFVIVSIASFLSPGIVNYIYKYPPSQLFTYEFVVNPRAHEQFREAYMKSHTRYFPYLIGFFSGIFYLKLINRKQRMIPQRWAVFGAVGGMIVLTTILFSASLFLWYGYSMTGSVLYAVLNRAVWGCSLTILVLSCAFGHVPFVKSFLSWSAWVPLSRLSYGIYLTHSFIIIRKQSVIRNSQHNDYVNHVVECAGVMVWGYIGSLLIWVLAEAPFNKLVNVVLLPRKKSSDEENHNVNISHLPDKISSINIDSSKI